ncbi:MAG: capsular exopolysaccharide family [Solirubrobacterales bacterium]|nr:capsular exopolysaccharide family [Solirubrobacterales bacterium]
MLGRRAWVILLAVVVGVVAALIFSASQSKRYESTAKLLFKPTLIDYAVSGVTLQVPNQDPVREAATNLGLLALDEVRQRAAARLGPDYTPKRIKRDVKVSSSGTSDIVSITASAPTSDQSARVADAVATAFVTYQRNAQRDQVAAAADTVRRDLKQHLPAATATALRASLERLNLLAAVQTGGVKVVQRADPPSGPSSPKPVLNGVLGGAIGLLLGLGLALASEQLDRRVRRVGQLQGALGVPVLASVPRSRLLRRRTDFEGHDADAVEEPFRRLRASLRHGEGEAERRSVLVTSARKGSGKTTVATHLAAALARGGLANVLLIEADLRRPRLATFLNLPSERGLSTLLQAGVALGPEAADHIFRIPLGGGSNGSGPGGPEMLGFDALPAGPPPDHPSEMLESGAMRDLLLAAGSSYDLVVIEAPPPTLVSDAIPLMKQADGVLIVGRLGRESEPELRQLRDELERFGVTPMGAVANFSRRSNPYYAKRA